MADVKRSSISPSPSPAVVEAAEDTTLHLEQYEIKGHPKLPPESYLPKVLFVFLHWFPLPPRFKWAFATPPTEFPSKGKEGNLSKFRIGPFQGQMYEKFVG
eukprot:1393699-Amorphochlora_amoeboformis.AAC.2